MPTPKASRRQGPERAAISPRDEALAFDLASGMTQVEAAKKHKINARSIRKKLIQPAFQALITEKQAALLTEAVRKFGLATSEAAIVMRKLLRSSDESIQLRTCVAIVEATISLGDFHELRESLRNLESRANSSRNRRPTS